MKIWARLSLATAVSAMAACGSFTDGGDGTKTLEIQARASFQAGDANMNIRISVDQHGAHVTGATVTLRDDDTEQVFPIDEDNNAYRTTIAGAYRRKLELKVTSGGDKASAKLDGPGTHFISSPFDNTTVKLGSDPLTVHWAVSDGLRADNVAISVDGSDYRGETNQDRGKVDIPRELLRPGDDIIRVERSNVVDMKGGVDGSTFTISYEANSHIHFTD